MKISILISDLSTNCIVRTYPIAKALERKFTVEIIGLIFNDKKLFLPYISEFDYRIVNTENSVSWFWRKTVPELQTVIDGDIIYAFKPLPTSFGIGLFQKFKYHMPLVLDIEDDEIGQYFDYMSRRNLAKYFFSKLNEPNHLLYRILIQYFAKKADEVTVVSRYLQRKFGGTLLPHGADTNFFDPLNFNKKDSRNKWGFSLKDYLIIWTGTPQPHKGFDDLIDALVLLKNPCIKIVIVGGNNSDTYLQRLLIRVQDYVIHLGYQNHSAMPELLSTADLVVLPQKNFRVTRAQIPGKIFEAMSMALPIIGTDMSDIPNILEGCGIVIPPQNPESLAEAINRLFHNLSEGKELGYKAREKCINLYSWKAMENILLKVFSRFT